MLSRTQLARESRNTIFRLPDLAGKRVFIWGKMGQIISEEYSASIVISLSQLRKL